MIRLIFTALGALAILGVIGITSLFGTNYTQDYDRGWCAGFAESELEARSRGFPPSARKTQTHDGFIVRRDDGRLMPCPAG